MISWEEYIKSNISEFRRRFGVLPKDSQKLIRKTKKLYSQSLIKPCQVVVIDLNGYPQSFVVAHNAKSPDMEVLVFKSSSLPDLTAKSKQEERLLNLLGKKETIEDFIEEFERFLRWGTSSPTAWISRTTMFLSAMRIFSWREDPQLSEGSYEFADLVYHYTDWDLKQIFREEQLEKIEETVEDIQRDIEAIPEDIELRSKIKRNTQRLNNQMKQLYKKVDEEIGALRKLIGSTESIQDWRLLVSDVARLKGEHVPREVLESKLQGLSTKIEALEKIEKAYERLSSQQEKVLEQQSGFLKWIKYSIILVPIAVACVPIVETLLRHFLGVS